MTRIQAIAVGAFVVAAAFLIQVNVRGAPATDGGVSPAPSVSQSLARSGWAPGWAPGAGLDGSRGLGAWLDGSGEWIWLPPTPSPEPQSSAVAVQSLNAVEVPVPAATVYVRIDPAGATPVATSRAVETFALESSDVTILIAASPWPQYLWGTVACLVQRESRGDPLAVGSAMERGWLQLHPVNWPYLAQYGITPAGLFDPATNLRAGYLLYLEAGGFGPWGGCA